MTLELTPEQRTDITGAVTSAVQAANEASAALWDAPPFTQAAVQARAKRLQSLLDLLNTPGTTLILHRP
jgi:delta 1-pyrroline-5-carboxylate dehydrogenase